MTLSNYKKTTEICYVIGNLIEYLFALKKLPFLPSLVYTASEKVFDDIPNICKEYLEFLQVLMEIKGSSCL